MRAAALLVAAAVLLLPHASLSAPGDGKNWVSRFAEPGRVLQVSPRSLALDAAGNPHAAFGSSQLRYAKRVAGVWQVEVVDDTPGVATNTSLAIDAAGKAHIAYYDGVNNRLLYTTNASGAWVPEVILAGGGVECSIAVDAQSHVHIASTGGRYSTNASGTWKTEILDAGAESTVLAVAPSGDVTVAYEDDADVWIARGRAGSFQTERAKRWIDLIGEADGGQSGDPLHLHDVALDPSGKVHVMAFVFFYHIPYGDGARLYRLTDAGGSWSARMLDRGDIADFRSSVSVEATGESHVTFTGDLTDDLGSGLVYARTSGALEVLGPVSNGSSIDVAADGTVHILNDEFDRGIVHYAGTAGAFVSEVAVTTDIRGISTSVVLDPSGAASVAHTTSRGLTVSTNAGGTWTGVDVDPQAAAGSRFHRLGAFLALDSAGNAHVAYHSSADGSTDRAVVRYATSAGGSWVIEGVSPLLASDVGGIHVAADGTVHVGYSTRNGAEFNKYEVRHGRRANGTWSFEVIASGTVQVEAFGIDSAGHAHFVFVTDRFNQAELRYASNVSGAWVIDDLSQYDVTEPTLALDNANAPHIVCVGKKPTGLPDGLLHLSRAGGTWSAEYADPTDANGRLACAAFDTAGALHVLHTSSLLGSPGSLFHSTNAGGAWSTQVVDRGSGGTREFAISAYRAQESAASITIDVTPAGAASVGTGASLAVAGNGDLHVTYHDGTLGALKLAVRSLTPSPPVISVDYETKSGGARGTATAGEDYTETSGTLHWDVEDSAAKSFTIPLAQDAEYEGNETVTLELSNPTTGVVLGTLNPVALTIEDDDGPVLPVGAVSSFILPKSYALKLNAKTPAKSRLTIAGFADLGPAPPNLRGPATLVIGSLTLAIPAMERQSNGSYRHAGGGVTLTVSGSKTGSSKGKFKLVWTDDLASKGLSPSTTLTLRLTAGTVDGSSQFRTTDGVYRLQAKKGELFQPRIFPFSVKAGLKGGGKDTLSLKAGLGNPGNAPAAAPDVRIAFGPTFAVDIPAASLEKSGDTYKLSAPVGGITALELNYATETVTIAGNGLTLGAFPEGPSPVVISLKIGTAEKVVALRLVKKGKSLKY